MRVEYLYRKKLEKRRDPCRLGSINKFDLDPVHLDLPDVAGAQIFAIERHHVVSIAIGREGCEDRVLTNQAPRIREEESRACFEGQPEF